MRAAGEGLVRGQGRATVAARAWLAKHLLRMRVKGKFGGERMLAESWVEKIERTAAETRYTTRR